MYMYVCEGWARCSIGWGFLGFLSLPFFLFASVLYTYIFIYVYDCVIEWVSLVRRGGSGVKIVPRILLEGWTMADFQEVFASEATMTQVAEFAARNLQVYIQAEIHGATYIHRSIVYMSVGIYISFLQKHRFDGMVLEVWSQLGGHYKRWQPIQ